jgi:hypothetical protein
MTESTGPASSNAPASAEPRKTPPLSLLAAPLPPEDLMVARAQAFRQLSNGEREDLLHRIAEQLPPAERALAGPANANPLGLARLLQRLEGRDPGLLGRVLAGTGRGGRVQAALLGGLGAGVAGGVVGGLVGGAAAAAVLTGVFGIGEAQPSAEGDWLGDLFDAGGLDGF